MSTKPYLVVVNSEEQYSIWPATLDLPRDWSAVGSPAAKEDCLTEIERLWTDMRPLSLRTRTRTTGCATQGATR
ncbi:MULTISPECIES: MbtH family NRPS accessory protein [unclassified Streptomyces]|uniref:MbtH family protein n=1 Tax=unclassified Streptomyces TaxID=2593676 RepID=UPI0033DB6401